MKTGMAPKQAQTQLDKQIEILGGLRNAGTRATEFREWRQTTLTLIERIWPDQPTRAMRFRRIPFSPTSAKADDRLAREAFERGCAEARRLLKLWLADISTHGVTQDAEAPRLAEAVRQALVEHQQSATEAAEHPAPASAPRAKTAPKGGPRNPRRPKRSLNEMLGLPNSPAGGADAPASGAPAPATRPDAAGPELPPEFELPGAESVARVTSHAKPRPGARVTHAREPQATPPPDVEATPQPDPSDRLSDPLAMALQSAKGEMRRLTPDPADPIDSLGRNHDVVPGVEQRALVSYVARAFIMMAGDIGELGVPEGHQQRVRLALLDLAHHLDCGSITWALLRDAVTLVMHYPALGRQALPLLLPYLENAA